MVPEMNKETATLSIGDKFLQLCTILVIFHISSIGSPAAAYSVRGCHITWHTDAKCGGSNMKAFPMDIPPKVTTLDLSFNKISKITKQDLKKLTNLSSLDLNHNIISEIEDGAFTRQFYLEVLVLSSNRLVELRNTLFEGLVNLKDLRLAHNHIKTVASSSFKPLANLKFLDLSRNRLQNLSSVGRILQNAPYLHFLSISSNNFSAFRSAELSTRALKLASLDISRNPIEVFRITANIFPNLTKLNLANCGKKTGIVFDVRNESFLCSLSGLDISGATFSLKAMREFLQSLNASLTSLRLTTMPKDLETLIAVSCNIPSLATLKLQHNRMRVVGRGALHACTNVTELYLADNLIRDLPEDSLRPLRRLRIFDLRKNHLQWVPPAVRNLPTLVELDLSSNNITALRCGDFANLTGLRRLYLYDCKVSALLGCAFDDLGKLEVLKLRNNRINQLNSAFKRHFPNLKALDLGENELTVIGRGEFSGLGSLQNLTLQQNRIKTLKSGAFIGLHTLSSLILAINELEGEQLRDNVFGVLISLKNLNFMDNHIRYKSDVPIPSPPFRKLSQLKTLLLSGQHSRLKSCLPQNILQGLMNLSELSFRNIQLRSLNQHTFNYTHGLESLYLSSNELIDISSELFAPIQQLKELYISRTNLRSLDFLLSAGLNRLEFLQVRKNAFSVISELVIQSLPALVYLDMQGNSFTCDCDNAWFLWWVVSNNRTQVFDAYNFECNYPPDLRGTKLLDIDVHSCMLDVGLICFLSTACMVVLFLVASFTYHFLRWQMVYAYYLLLAYLFNTKQKNRRAHQYDAFISYNIHDEPWVLGELLPKLEDEQGWRLCLHHRDFQPGKPIMDNITDAIYGSKKTICVISRRYLESEWCSREIQVASFRLFDEQKDVLILVFLEDIPTSLLSPYYRMRKLLKRHTYLSWPKAAPRPSVFWEKLRKALETKDELGGDNLLLTEVERTQRKP